MSLPSKLYASSVLFAASWAMWMEIALQGSSVEHTLPGAILIALSMPLSLLVFALPQEFELAKLSAIAQLLVFCLCGGVQAWVLHQFSGKRCR